MYQYGSNRTWKYVVSSVLFLWGFCFILQDPLAGWASSKDASTTQDVAASQEEAAS